MNLPILPVLVAILVALLLASVVKLDSKENYCVDISGGFKAPCDCLGYKEVKP